MNLNGLFEVMLRFLLLFKKKNFNHVHNGWAIKLSFKKWKLKNNHKNLNIIMLKYDEWLTNIER